MSLKKDVAIRMFESAKAYCEAKRPYEVAWANSVTPEHSKI
jgi:hypothetical protein